MNVFKSVKLTNSGIQHSAFQLAQRVTHLVRVALVHQTIVSRVLYLLIYSHLQTHVSPIAPQTNTSKLLQILNALTATQHA